MGGIDRWSRGLAGSRSVKTLWRIVLGRSIIQIESFQVLPGPANREGRLEATHALVLRNYDEKDD